jgi:hypothetical protein
MKKFKFKVNFFDRFGMNPKDDTFKEDIEEKSKEEEVLPEEDIQEEEGFLVSLPSNNRTSVVFDPYSGTWAFIKEYCEEGLDKLRKKNDTITLSVEKTAVIRGEIKRLKKILSIPEALKK